MFIFVCALIFFFVVRYFWRTKQCLNHRIIGWTKGRGEATRMFKTGLFGATELAELSRLNVRLYIATLNMKGNTNYARWLMANYCMGNAAVFDFYAK